MKRKRSPPPLLLLLLLPLLASADATVGLNDDVLGLVVFKTGLADPSGALSTWSEDDDSPCSAAWRFVRCDPASGRVTAVSLDGLGLSGRLSSLGLEKLSSLQSLSLSGNDLTGPVPSGLSLLPSLRRLDLSRNSLSGAIPDSLFSDGPLCGALRHLDLSGNQLDGQVPPPMRRCSLLVTLNLADNRLTGANFADTIYTLTELRSLDLSGNAFSGQVPDGIAALRSLSSLRLSSNVFSGPIPSSLGLCPRLSHLDLSSNSFSGDLPESLRHLAPSLSHLNTSHNPLSGVFPTWLPELRGLRSLDLSGNRLPGAIPPELFGLALEEVLLAGVGLEGAVPAGSTSLFEALRRLDLSGNAGMTGGIPAEMALFFNLRELNLSGNGMGSRVPPELGYIRNLTVVDLSGTGLYGELPAGICDSASIEVLRLDGNNLQGPLPEEIGNCSSLYVLGLSHNQLRGPIPPSISKLRNLKILSLEFNGLTGEIPPELATLDNLQALNLSHNRLVGRIPSSRAFQSLNPSALQGNLGLCSPLLSQPCVMTVPKPLVLDPNYYNTSPNSSASATSSSSTTAAARNRRFLSVSVIASISAAVALAIGVMIISLLNASVRRRLGHVQNVLESACSLSTSSKAGPVGPLVWFDKWQPLGAEPEGLLRKATELGRGAFGTVYKAAAGGSGGARFVAVKKLLTSNIIQCHVEFDREVRNLAKALHPNLMPIRGYYWTPQLRLLFSELAAHGSLQSHLHPASPDAPRLRLPWPDRFNIALGTAEAVAYLHHKLRPPVIHYNLKPGNILLDGDLNPRVSDFGLARLLPKVERRVAMSRFELGYVAPELACRSLRVTEKCDVYGFGVVVLELVTGRKAVEYGGDDVTVLVEDVRTALDAGRVLEMVDGEMGEWGEDEVVPVLKLGLVCASQVPSSRPSMAEVVEILRVIRPREMDKAEEI